MTSLIQINVLMCGPHEPCRMLIGADKRRVIEAHLKQAERHVAQGERHIDEQRERVILLERDGHDSTDALLLLGHFEEIQTMHICDRDRLRRELAELGPS